MPCDSSVIGATAGCYGVTREGLCGLSAGVVGENSTSARGIVYRAQSLRKATGGSPEGSQGWGTQARQEGPWSPGVAASVPETWRCCPHLLTPAPPQIVGSRLRIPQVTPADSGEYVCHVSNGAGSQETSLIVTIQGGGSSHGENSQGGGGGGLDQWGQGRQ